MTAERKYGHREYMAMLVATIGRDPDVVIPEYAQAERDGVVQHKRNASGLNPEEYARALYADGERKGWFFLGPEGRKGEHFPADLVGNDGLIARIATGVVEENPPGRTLARQGQETGETGRNVKSLCWRGLALRLMRRMMRATEPPGEIRSEPAPPPDPRSL